MAKSCGVLAAVLSATFIVVSCSTLAQKREADVEYADYDELSYHLPAAPVSVPVLVKKKSKKDEQDLSKIPGIPGVDYPVYHSVPPTSFSCNHVPYLPGMYANVETGCQAYHVCHDGREGEQGASFLCTNGTVFNQKQFGCDWWYNVNCAEAQDLYRLNGDPLTNPYVPEKEKQRIREGLKSAVF